METKQKYEKFSDEEIPHLADFIEVPFMVVAGLVATIFLIRGIFIQLSAVQLLILTMIAISLNFGAIVITRIDRQYGAKEANPLMKNVFANSFVYVRNPILISFLILLESIYLFKIVSDLLIAMNVVFGLDLIHDVRLHFYVFKAKKLGQGGVSY
jgi:hypothetical protein